MSDQCFVCLSNTRIKKCSQCNLRSHYKCWAEYLKHSKTVDIRCPQCSIIIDHRVVTRSFDKKQEFDSTVRYYLRRVSNTIGIPIRQKEIIKEMYKFMYKNFKFVDKDLELQMRIKLVELYINNNWKDAENIYMETFGTSIHFDNNITFIA